MILHEREPLEYLVWVATSPVDTLECSGQTTEISVTGPRSGLEGLPGRNGQGLDLRYALSPVVPREFGLHRERMLDPTLKSSQQRRFDFGEECVEVLHPLLERRDLDHVFGNTRDQVRSEHLVEIPPGRADRHSREPQFVLPLAAHPVEGAA